MEGERESETEREGEGKRNRAAERGKISGRMIDGVETLAHSSFPQIASRDTKINFISSSFGFLTSRLESYQKAKKKGAKEIREKET